MSPTPRIPSFVAYIQDEKDREFVIQTLYKGTSTDENTRAKLHDIISPAIIELDKRNKLVHSVEYETKLSIWKSFYEKFSL
jgi:hypothetical protein